MAVTDIKLLLEGWSEKCFHSVWMRGFKAEQRLVFGRTESRHIRLFCILPRVLSPHFYRVGYDYKLGNAEEFSLLQQTLIFQTFCFNLTATISSWGLAASNRTLHACGFMYRKMVKPKHMYLENTIEWPAGLHLSFFFFSKWADPRTWPMWLLLR